MGRWFLNIELQTLKIFDTFEIYIIQLANYVAQKFVQAS